MQKRLIVELASGIARFRAVNNLFSLHTYAHIVLWRTLAAAFPAGSPIYFIFYSAPIFRRRAVGRPSVPRGIIIILKALI